MKREMAGEGETNRERFEQRDRQRDRDRETETETERETERETDRQTETEAERQTDRQTVGWTHRLMNQSTKNGRDMKEDKKKRRNGLDWRERYRRRGRKLLKKNEGVSPKYVFIFLKKF